MLRLDYALMGCSTPNLEAVRLQCVISFDQAFDAMTENKSIHTPIKRRNADAALEEKHAQHITNDRHIIVKSETPPTQNMENISYKQPYNMNHEW